MIDPLTGVRGYAALWVVLYHQRTAIHALLPDQQWLGMFADFGYLGVDLFAILSGFVISLTYGERLKCSSRVAAERYLWLRLARIYPLHLFALLACVAGSVLTGERGGSEALESGAFWRQFLLLNGWGFESQWAWNVPSWTVSAEWFCYLAFLFVAPLLARVRRGATAVRLAALVLFATTLSLATLGYPTLNADLQWGLLRIGGEFLAGCLLYRAHAAGFRRSLPWGWIGLGALIFSLVLLAWLVPLSIAGFAVLVYALAQDRAPLRMLFGNRVSVFLGEISYSIYLLHWFFLTLVLPGLVSRYYGTRDPAWIPFLALIAVVGISTLSYFGVEKPSRRRLRAWIDARQERVEPY